MGGNENVVNQLTPVWLAYQRSKFFKKLCTLFKKKTNSIKYIFLSVSSNFFFLKICYLFKEYSCFQNVFVLVLVKEGGFYYKRKEGSSMIDFIYIKLLNLKHFDF